MAGSVGPLRSRGGCRARSAVADSRQDTPGQRGSRRAGRGATHAGPVRGTAPHLRRSAPEGGVPVAGERFPRSGEGGLRDAGGEDPAPRNGWLLPGRSETGQPGPTVDAGRLSTRLSGTVRRSLGPMDGVVHAHVRRARHSGSPSGGVTREAEPILENAGALSRADLECVRTGALNGLPRKGGKRLP